MSFRLFPFHTYYFTNCQFIPTRRINNPESRRCNGVLEGIRIVRQGFPNRIAYAEFKQRYQILAAAAIPTGFIEAKSATEIIIKALGLTDDEAKFGNTKVFFRAGILGRLEDLRDEKITEILSAFQALARGWIARKIYKKLMEQR